MVRGGETSGDAGNRANGKPDLEPNTTSAQVIGAAIEVHRSLGPGLLETAYETCLMLELEARGLGVERQVGLSLTYRGHTLDCGYRLDLVVEGEIIVEIKSVECLLPIHTAQLLSYLRFSPYRVGLLINFNVALLKNGLIRRVL